MISQRVGQVYEAQHECDNGDEKDNTGECEEFPVSAGMLVDVTHAVSAENESRSTEYSRTDGDLEDKAHQSDDCDYDGDEDEIECPDGGYCTFFGSGVEIDHDLTESSISARYIRSGSEDYLMISVSVCIWRCGCRRSSR